MTKLKKNKYLEIENSINSDELFESYSKLKSKAIEQEISLFNFHQLIRLKLNKRNEANKVEDNSGWVINNLEFSNLFELKDLFENILDISNTNNIHTKKATDKRENKEVILKILKFSSQSEIDKTYFMEKHNLDNRCFSSTSEIYRFKNCFAYFRNSFIGNQLSEVIKQTDRGANLSSEDKELIHSIWKMISELKCSNVQVIPEHIIILERQQKELFFSKKEYDAHMVGFNHQVSLKSKEDIEREIHQLLSRLMGANYSTYLNTFK